jgi:hypothetical protein
MMIWECRNPGIAPQHIGNCDRPTTGDDLARILSNAQAAGHSRGYRVAAIWYKPGREDQETVNLYRTREDWGRVKSMNGFAVKLFYEAPEQTA